MIGRQHSIRVAEGADDYGCVGHHQRLIEASQLAHQLAVVRSTIRKNAISWRTCQGLQVFLDLARHSVDDASLFFR